MTQRAEQEEICTIDIRSISAAETQRLSFSTAIDQFSISKHLQGKFIISHSIIYALLSIYFCILAMYDPNFSINISSIQLQYDQFIKQMSAALKQIVKVLCIQGYEIVKSMEMPLRCSQQVSQHSLYKEHHVCLGVPILGSPTTIQYLTTLYMKLIFRIPKPSEMLGHIHLDFCILSNLRRRGAVAGYG